MIKLMKLRRLKRLARDEQGSAMIEAALGIPILLTALVGVFEIANFYFVSASVENAVLHASRFGVTGGADDGVTREDQVRAIIEKQTFGMVDMDTVVIETLVYEQFADIGEPEPFTDQNGSGDWDEGEPYADINGNGAWDDDMAIAGLGGAGDIVLYRVNYEANSLTGFMDWAHRALNISSTVAVRNEPF
jgi:Flp pilus assembly pilin Flp